VLQYCNKSDIFSLSAVVVALYGVSASLKRTQWVVMREQLQFNDLKQTAVSRCNPDLCRRNLIGLPVVGGCV